ncbi:GAF domain-containing protein [Actinoplanes sp. NPDC049316]|uniref:GAF domain-containing protein n=1 Tax=Actinoplanes sp. NPDC049316 TaxID=3154727 RepID=UPI0034199ECB
MPSRSSVDAMVTAQIAAIAGLSTGIADRAEAVLEHLRLVMNFDAACVTLLEADGRRQPPLLCQGYPATVVEHLHSADFLASVESLGLNRNRTPLRVADLQVPGAELATWAEFMTPAGFHEGIGIPLHSPDRRYLGVLATHTCDRTPVSDDTRDLLADLAPLIARAVDPLRTITALASLVTDAIAGVVLTRSGATAPLHGLPGHRLLASGSPVVAEAAACYADGDSRAAFLTPAQPPDPSGYLRVTMLACPHPSHDLNAVVVLRPPGNLHHLSHREMTILGMLIAGWTPARSANHLGMSLRAVHTALEHARVKLGEASTAAAIMRAADLGLYLPPTTPG